MQLFRITLIAITSLVLFSCNGDSSDEEAQSNERTPAISYTVENHFSHDTTLFTEGFLCYQGHFFESSGAPEELKQCKSVVGISDLTNGKFSPKIEIDRNKYFGEGIAVLNNKIYQLTYKNQKGFVYDLNTFKQLNEFTYTNKEGWGMTTNGKDLLMSDGTSAITFFDTATLKPIKTLKVTENGLLRDSLNELEFIKGYLYANIWLNNSVVKIDTATGKVIGKLDLSALTQVAAMKNPKLDALNGIAYDAQTDKIYVTGKLWKNVYEIAFEH
ncbi:MAG: glutaminyl-peptide cyclotransferase [Chitinophagaceae bacterium]